MSSNKKNGLSRREALKSTGGLAAAGVLAGVTIPAVHAVGDETIRVALVGCGGRGNGAASNALSTAKLGPIKLVALADVFQSRLDSSYNTLSRSFQKQVDVPPDRRFLGFDGYKKAIDGLKKGDVVIFATPPAFRWVMFGYAIEKGVNVFMEKPTTVDGPSTKKMLKLAAESEVRKLKVGVGLMCRHCAARGELYKRIKNGEIGDIVLLRAYRQAGPTGSAFVMPNTDPKMSELLYQIRNFHGFLWASGGGYSDFLVHNIDESCWMKDAWPVEAKGAGGRHYRGDHVDQNFDSYSVEYTFEDGSKLNLEGRTMPRCHQEFASYAHGSKGSAIISTSGHVPARCRIFKGQKMGRGVEPLWAFPQPEPDPYQLEWDHLIEAIRQDTPYNEAKRGAEASLVTAMGRMAAHTGQTITYQQMLECEHEFAPELEQLTLESAAPLRAGKDGKYAVPEPGRKGRKEF